MYTSYYGEKVIKEFIAKIRNCSMTIAGTQFDNKEFLKDKQFEQICTSLSLFLPRNSDPDLSEIDDLILPNYNQLNDDSFRLYYEDALLSLIEASLHLYYKITFDKLVRYPIFSVLLVQMLEIYTNGLRITDIRTDAQRHAQSLIETWDLKNACLALKILRVLEKDSEYFACKLSEGLMEWLYKVRNVPQPNCPIKQRFAGWMRHQSDILLVPLNKDTSMLRWNRGYSTWTLDPSRVVHLLGYQPTNIFQLDHLYNYFMSSNDRSQRIKLIEYFIKGCIEINEKNGPLRVMEMPNKLLFLGYMYHLVDQFCSYFNYILKFSPYIKKNKLEELEKYLHGCRLEPYLTENSGGLTRIRTWDGHGMNIASKGASNSGSQSDDLTIEEHIFFDAFLNRLELVNIVQTAFWKTADILQMEKFPEGYESMVFWTRNGRTTNTRAIITGILRNPGSIPKESLKWLELTMKMCPFLYLARGHESYANDLLKVMRGEEVDEPTFEELYFVVNGVGIDPIFYTDNLRKGNIALTEEAYRCDEEPMRVERAKKTMDYDLFYSYLK